MSLNTLGNKAASITAILVLAGMVIGFLDVRHAKATDFEAFRVEKYEDKLEEVNDQINLLELMGVDTLTRREQLELAQLRNIKDKTLRKLGRTDG